MGRRADRPPRTETVAYSQTHPLRETRVTEEECRSGRTVPPRRRITDTLEPFHRREETRSPTPAPTVETTRSSEEDVDDGGLGSDESKDEGYTFAP